MKRMYQKEWQGIQFDEFANLSSTQLADGQFYGKFYEAFFDCFKTWNDIAPSWRDQKKLVADFLYHLILDQRSEGEQILSVGCGLGYIEHTLIRLGVDPVHLDVSEVVEVPFRWVQEELHENNIHLGFIPECLPKDRKYSLIYMVAVDYIMDQHELIAFLRNLRPWLAPGGRCVIISASYNEDSYGLAMVKRGVKDAVKFLLDGLRLRPLGQFWGYMRNRREYRFAMKSLGVADVQDGFIESSKDKIYWISAKV